MDMEPASPSPSISKNSSTSPLITSRVPVDVMGFSTEFDAIQNGNSIYRKLNWRSNMSCRHLQKLELHLKWLEAHKHGSRFSQTNNPAACFKGG